ncbi:hypothetical protein HT746_17800 [Burkholderia pyrrocinia]|uniref:hypothetical protein n=1 Tax=Burkholderia pyrrocinia TaxID=60550 RepID=UPI0015773D77|nr:hypothetical protein [Burkholderia pyrrocinia]NTX28963.1 hypothetical protein [Burkholderia pyrrocinia]
MRNIFFALLAFFLLDGAAKGELASNGHAKSLDNVFLLSNRCGYGLGENILSKTIDSSINIDNKIISFDFYLVMRLGGRSIRGKLSFSCFVDGLNASGSNVSNKTTAADEIAFEDSGGRYVRNIVWQRKYEGKGWSGTVAYVNSVYGDQERLATPDYFLICPYAINSPCFSFEVLGKRLDKKESDLVPVALGGIEIVDLRSTAPERNDGRQ